MSQRNQVARNFVKLSDLSSGDISRVFPYALCIPPELEFELSVSILLIGGGGLWCLMKISSGLISQGRADQCGLVLVNPLASCFCSAWIFEFVLPGLVHTA